MHRVDTAVPRSARLLAATLVACGSLLACAAPARASDAERRVLIELLPTLEARHLVRATLLTREVVVGHPRLVRGDTVWLAPPDGAGVARSAPLVPVWTDLIVRLEQRRPATDMGAKIGGGSGAVVGGLLGVLVGAWAAGWSDDGKDVPILLTCTMGGAAMGAAAGGLLGSGVGAVTTAWLPVWPDREAERKLRADRERARADSLAALVPRPRTRILLEAGCAATGGPWDRTGLALGAGLLGAPRPWLNIGPVIRFQDLGGLADVPPTTVTGERTLLQPILSASLEARAARPATGWKPWVRAGLGLSLASDVYPSAHLGLGARVRDGAGRDFGLVIDRHFMLGDMADAARGQWAASFVLTFVP